MISPTYISFEIAPEPVRVQNPGNDANPIPVLKLVITGPDSDPNPLLGLILNPY